MTLPLTMTLHSLVDPEQAPAAPKAGPPPKKLIKKPPPKGFYQDSSEDEVDEMTLPYLAPRLAPNPPTALPPHSRQTAAAAAATPRTITRNPSNRMPAHRRRRMT